MNILVMLWKNLRLSARRPGHGPFTPGYVADAHLASELAEIGIILLMFGVGLGFSLKDLLSVGALAVPGAIVQIAVATGLGMGLAAWLGWPPARARVRPRPLGRQHRRVLRALQERRILETGGGGSRSAG